MSIYMRVICVVQPVFLQKKFISKSNVERKVKKRHKIRTDRIIEDV